MHGIRFTENDTSNRDVTLRGRRQHNKKSPSFSRHRRVSNVKVYRACLSAKATVFLASDANYNRKRKRLPSVPLWNGKIRHKRKSAFRKGEVIFNGKKLYEAIQADFQSNVQKSRRLRRTARMLFR